MARNWKTLSSKIVYKNHWIKIHEDKVLRPDSQEGIYAYLEKPAGTFTIALDKTNHIYLIKEYRYPIKSTIIQLPAGVMETNNIIQQAKKELLEETGITAHKWEKLGRFYVGAGHETTPVNVVLATDLDVSELKTGNQENDEAIQKIIKISLPELKELIVKGKIKCGITLAALNIFLLKQQKNN